MYLRSGSAVEARPVLGTREQQQTVCYLVFYRSHKSSLETLFKVVTSLETSDRKVPLFRSTPLLSLNSNQDDVLGRTLNESQGQYPSAIAALNPPTLYQPADQNARYRADRCQKQLQ